MINSLKKIFGYKSESNMKRDNNESQMKRCKSMPNISGNLLLGDLARRTIVKSSSLSHFESAKLQSGLPFCTAYDNNAPQNSGFHGHTLVKLPIYEEGRLGSIKEQSSSSEVFEEGVNNNCLDAPCSNTVSSGLSSYDAGLVDTYAPNIDYDTMLGLTEKEQIWTDIVEIDKPYKKNNVNSKVSLNSKLLFYKPKESSTSISKTSSELQLELNIKQLETSKRRDSQSKMVLQVSSIIKILTKPITWNSFRIIWFPKNLEFLYNTFIYGESLAYFRTGTILMSIFLLAYGLFVYYSKSTLPFSFRAIILIFSIALLISYLGFYFVSKQRRFAKIRKIIYFLAGGIGGITLVLSIPLVDTDNSLSIAGYSFKVFIYVCFIYIWWPISIFQKLFLGILYSVTKVALVAIYFGKKEAFNDLILLVSLNSIGCFFSFSYSLIFRRSFINARIFFQNQKNLEKARLHSERLLKNILPIKIIDEFKQARRRQFMKSSHEQRKSVIAVDFGLAKTKQQGSMSSSYCMLKESDMKFNVYRGINDHFAEIEGVTIMFADIVGFTEFASSVNAEYLVTILSVIFEKFDIFAESLGLEKIKTIGDCYQVCAGVPVGPKSEIEKIKFAKKVCTMASCMLKAIEEVSEQIKRPLKLRIGIHTGTVLAGVMGGVKFKYDVWSENVRIAAIMEQTSTPNVIHISKDTAALLEGDRRFILKYNSLVDVGMGKFVETFQLIQIWSHSIELMFPKEVLLMLNQVENTLLNAAFIEEKDDCNDSRNNETKSDCKIDLKRQDSKRDDETAAYLRKGDSAYLKKDVEEHLTYKPFVMDIDVVSKQIQNSEFQQLDKLTVDFFSSSLKETVLRHKVKKISKHFIDPSVELEFIDNYTVNFGLHVSFSALIFLFIYIMCGLTFAVFYNSSYGFRIGMPIYVVCLVLAGGLLATREIQRTMEVKKVKAAMEAKTAMETTAIETKIKEKSKNASSPNIVRVGSAPDIVRSAATKISAGTINNGSLNNSTMIHKSNNLHNSAIIKSSMILHNSTILNQNAAVNQSAILINHSTAANKGSSLKNSTTLNNGTTPINGETSNNNANNAGGDVEENLPAKKPVVIRPWPLKLILEPFYFIQMFFAILTTGTIISSAVIFYSSPNDFALLFYSFYTFIFATVIFLGSGSFGLNLMIAIGTVIYNLLFILSLDFSNPGLHFIFQYFIFVAISILVCVLTLVCNFQVELTNRKNFQIHGFLEEKIVEINYIKNEADRLLHNILPSVIAKKLLANPEKRIAERYSRVCVLFLSIANFRNYDHHSQKRALLVLNRIICQFDSYCQMYGVEKIKTSGDVYMAMAGGFPCSISKPSHHRIIDYTLKLFEVIKKLNVEVKYDFELKAGIHSNFQHNALVGSVVGGVIGRQKFCFDIWGDTVNVAARMEQTCEPSKIQITEEFADVVRNSYDLQRRGEVSVKGKGKKGTFYLIGRKSTK